MPWLFTLPWLFDNLAQLQLQPQVCFFVLSVSVVFGDSEEVEILLDELLIDEFSSFFNESDLFDFFFGFEFA